MKVSVDRQREREWSRRGGKKEEREGGGREGIQEEGRKERTKNKGKQKRMKKRRITRKWQVPEDSLTLIGNKKSNLPNIQIPSSGAKRLHFEF